eukprot:SAG25_NODE_12182_length_286_cov_0.545455_1_plen_21_part_10
MEVGLLEVASQPPRYALAAVD